MQKLVALLEAPLQSTLREKMHLSGKMQKLVALLEVVRVRRPSLKTVLLSENRCPATRWSQRRRLHLGCGGQPAPRAPATSEVEAAQARQTGLQIPEASMPP